MKTLTFRTASLSADMTRVLANAGYYPLFATLTTTTFAHRTQRVAH